MQMPSPQENTMSSAIDYYLDQLRPLVGGTISALARTGPNDDPSEFELFGFVVTLRDGTKRTLLLLADDEGNGPGSFEISRP
jgi:hypothetical protein